MIIGIVGMGDMGKLYARIFSDHGYTVLGTDLPINLDSLTKEFEETNVKILDSGIDLVSQSDLIIYSVETNKIEEIVKELGPYTNPNAIVAGQTSVKHPEIIAFDKYLPASTHIVTIHSLHGPAISPAGQTLVVIRHRAKDEYFNKAMEVYQKIGSKIEMLDNYLLHDKMMADIQVVTHIGFESIGTSFMHRKVYPWENPLLTSGLDNLKMLLTLRIYSYKHHVYSGMALLNPFSAGDVRTYAESENEIFAAMISEDNEVLYKILEEAGAAVFKDQADKPMLNDQIMREFSLNPSPIHKPNSHLSLLSMVLTWHKLGTNPYKNLICQTPPFKLRVGMAEYLFMNKPLLQETLQAALFDKSIRRDDLAFHTAVQEWAHIVESGDLKAYESHFEKTRSFLEPRLIEGRHISNLMIERLQSDEQN